MDRVRKPNVSKLTLNATCITLVSCLAYISGPENDIFLRDND
jgi:hypothetical protein